MDNHELLRDVTLSIDKYLQLTDTFVVFSINNHYQGSAE